MSYTLFVVTKMFYKRAGLFALLSVCLLVLGPLAMYQLIQLAEGSGEGVGLQPFNYHFAYLGVSWLLFITVGIYALEGTQKVVFGLPVSSVAIFSWSVFSTISLFVILNLLTNALYRIVFFDENWLTDYWPLWGPTLFFSTLIMVGHCIFWNMHARSFMRLCFWVGFVIVMFWWFISRYYPDGFSESPMPWNQVTLSELITLQLVFVATWMIGIVSFAQVRCGTATPSLQWERIKSWSDQLMNGPLTAETQIPSSKPKGLASLHWRDSCYRTIVYAVYFGVIGLVFSLLKFREIETMLSKNIEFNNNPIVFTYIFLGLSVMSVHVFVGPGLNNKSMTEMKQYLAIVPLSDQVFSSILIRNLIKCVGLIFLLIVLLSFLLSHFIATLYFGIDILRTSWLWNLNQETHKFFMIEPILWCVGIWIVISNGLSLSWTGRNGFISLVTFAVFGCFIFGVLSIKFLIPESLQSAVIQAGTIFLSCCILVGTMVAYLIAFKKELIQSTIVRNAGLFCLLAPPIFWSFWYTDQVILKLFLSSLLILAVTPFATIPLAVSWNRHR